MLGVVEIDHQPEPIVRPTLGRMAMGKRRPRPNQILDQANFDGYFEGLDAERAIAGRATDSLHSASFSAWCCPRHHPIWCQREPTTSLINLYLCCNVRGIRPTLVEAFATDC